MLTAPAQFDMTTLKEHMAQQAASAARKGARKAKAALLWSGKPGKSVTKQKATYRKRLVAQLDAVFSLYIRMRDKRLRGHCPFYPDRPIECCFHFLSRVKFATRWNEYNAVGASHGANLRYEHDVILIHRVKAWYETNYGGGSWAVLEKEGQRKTPMTNLELEQILADLKKKMEAK